MTIINLTPHAVTCDGVTFEPSGTIARLAMADQAARPDADGLPVVEAAAPTAAATIALIETVRAATNAGDTAIVASMLLPHLRQGTVAGRRVVSPDTGPASAIRDEAGRIVGVRRFQEAV